MISKVYNARTIETVLDLLSKYREQSKIIAGGTDIMVALRNKKINPSVLINVDKIEEISKIEEFEDYIFIGSGVTFTKIVESPLFKENLYGLYKACRMVGSPQIRNKGTIGGNIVNGSTAADSVPPLMALDGAVTILNKEGKREVKLRDYFENPVKDDEFLLNIKFKKPNENEVLSFSKLGLRKALAISRVSLATYISYNKDLIIEKANVSSGALGKNAMKELEVEEFLIGKRLTDEVIEGSINILRRTVDKRLEGRSSLEFKREAVGSILGEALNHSRSFINGVKL